jgi:hypothetical protein
MEPAVATLLTINVKNLENVTQNFFFFQQPAVYVGNAPVYSNSLYQSPCYPFATEGTQLKFQAELQFYAGAQPASGMQPPQVGQTSGSSAASQPIDLTNAGGTASNNSTNMIINPVGLSIPAFTPGVEAGAFRIVTPAWNTGSQAYNVGSAVMANGSIVLSNFIQASPSANVDCQPILKYYVATGAFTPGTVMNFTQSSTTAATCDFTPGFTVANVTYNNDGTWGVTYE